MADRKWKQFHVRPGPKPKCDLCEKEVDIQLSKCLDCDLYLCDTCSQIHKKTPLMKNHQIITRVERETTKISKTSRMCSSHPNEEVTFYCSTCRTLICSECIIGKHDKHSCTKIKGFAAQKRRELKSRLEETQNVHIPQMKSKIAEINTQSILNDEIKSKKLQSLTNRIQQLESELTKIKLEIVTEYDNVHQRNQDKLQTVRTKLTHRLSETEPLYTDYNKILHTGSDIEVIMAEQELSEILQSIKSECVMDTGLQQPSVIEGETDDKILKTLYKYIQKEEDASSEASETDTETQCIGNNQFKHRSTIIQSICPLTDNTAFITYTGLYDNDIVTVDGQVQQSIKFNLQVVDFIMSQGHIICTPFGSDPNIYRLTKKGVVTDKISTAPLLPVCLCESRDGNLLVSLTDEKSYNINQSSRRCVSRITMKGKVLQSYEYNKGSRLFTRPRGVSENINGDVCVVNGTSETTGHLIILDNVGRLITTYNGQQLEEEFCPFYVKCDKVGNILVNDLYNQKVHMLNIQCQFVRYVVTENSLSDYPFSLAIDSNTGILWVGGHKGNVYTFKYLE